MKRRYLIAFLFLASQLYIPILSLPTISTLIETAQQYERTPITQQPFLRAISRMIRSKTAREQQDLLSRAWCAFLDTPGFKNIMRTICRQTDSGVGGHLFELESALKKHELHIKILSLNTHIASPMQLVEREFDVVCEESDGTHLLVECKDISWKNITRKRKKQFKNQRDIVTAHQRVGIPIKYLLHSKRTIPKKWRTWLSNNQIEFEEEEQDGSENN